MLARAPPQAGLSSPQTKLPLALWSKAFLLLQLVDVRVGKLHRQGRLFKTLAERRETELNSADTKDWREIFRAEVGKRGLMDNPGFEHSLYPKEKYSLSPFTIGGSFPALSRVSAEVRSLWSLVQFSSVAQSCPTLCDPMNLSMPGLPVHHQHPEFTQTQVY